VNCRERQDLLLLYAAGALDQGDAEGRELRAHLAAGCPACAAALAEAESTVAHLPLVLPPESPRAEVREKVLARIAELPRGAEKDSAGPSPAQATVTRPSPNWLLTAAAAAIAATLAGLGTYVVLKSPLDRTNRELAQLRTEVGSLTKHVADRDTRIQQLAADLAQSQGLLAALESRELAVVTLAPQPPAQPESAWGRVLWDKSRRQWHFHAFGLKPPAAGKTYELWLVTADMRKLPAGTFDPDARGNASLTVAVPPGEEMLALAAVTDEPTGGVPQPTGQFQLVGNIP
jgi:hypothetical protein